MDNIQNLNSDTYVVTPTTSKQSVTFSGYYGADAKAIITNTCTQPVFCVHGATDPTPVFPTSATTPVKGKVIPPNTMATFDIDPDTRFISTILLTAGTGQVFISIGPGI